MTTNLSRQQINGLKRDNLNIITTCGCGHNTYQIVFYEEDILKCCVNIAAKVSGHGEETLNKSRSFSSSSSCFGACSPIVVQ